MTTGTKKPMSNGAQAKTRCTAGFTLIEILVAVSILGLAYVAILQNFSLSLRHLVRLDNKRLALFDESQAFEQRIKYVAPGTEAGEEATGEKIAEKASGPTFLEGQRYRVVTVTSDNGEFMSMMLEDM